MHQPRPTGPACQSLLTKNHTPKPLRRENAPRPAPPIRPAAGDQPPRHAPGAGNKGADRKPSRPAGRPPPAAQRCRPPLPRPATPPETATPQHPMRREKPRPLPHGARSPLGFASQPPVSGPGPGAGPIIGFRRQNLMHRENRARRQPDRMPAMGRPVPPRTVLRWPLLTLTHRQRPNAVMPPHGSSPWTGSGRPPRLCSARQEKGVGADLRRHDG